MKIQVIFFTLIFSFFLTAQDSLKIYHPIPRRAAFLSAIIPGSGQVYNHIYSKKKDLYVYLKIPVIYTSLFISTSSLIDKINLEKEIRNEYNNRIYKKIISDKWMSYDDYDLILLQKSASKSRNTLYFITGGIYLLQILEASIDAHFTHFDISPDLTLDIKPFHTNFNSTGLTFTLNIK